MRHCNPLTSCLFRKIFWESDPSLILCWSSKLQEKLKLFWNQSSLESDRILKSSYDFDFVISRCNLLADQPIIN